MRLKSLYEAVASNGVQSAVAVVLNGSGQVLIGKSTASDSRNGKWCFPGGGIKDSTIEDAAAREAFEETGISCIPQGVIQFGAEGVPISVAFVLCLADNSSQLKPNFEFKELRWAHPADAIHMPEFFEPNLTIVNKLLDHELVRR